MEKDLKFSSAVCTSRVQSERLLSLGLKKETADCHWKDEAYFDDYEDWNAYVGSPKHSKHIPAWSLHRIMSMVYSCRTKKNGLRLAIIGYDNPFEDMIQQIEWLIKEGYFPKEYLV